MKKLLTTMSAVAVAMSLYATDSGALSGTSFEGLGAGPYSITAKGDAEGGELGTFTDGTTTYWVTNSTATLEIVAQRSSAATRPEAFDSYSQDRYLSIKTTLGNPVSRRVTATGLAESIGAGLYFDSLVKFTAFDGDQTVDLGLDGKLAIWLKENEEGPSTNLIITAGYIDSNGDATVTNYTCTVVDHPNLLDDGGWHRVTVRMINSIFTSGTTPGFLIAIDENKVVSGATKFVVPAGNSLTREADAFNAEGSLFPSALQTGSKTSITAVSFDGQGCVDDLVFTRTQPDCVKDPDFFTITISNDVASAKYALNGGSSVTITNTTGTGSVSVALPLASGTYFTISDVIPAPGFMKDEPYDLVGNITFDGSAYAPQANSELVIKAKRHGATITINGVDTPYETLAGAVDAINGLAAAASVKLTLKAPATSDIMLNNTEGADISVTLDLAGNNITSDGLGAAAVVVASGSLLITNSTPTVGHVIADSGVGIAVAAAGGALTISGGAYDGAVDVGGASAAQITGGMFRIAENAAYKTSLDAAAAPATLVAEAGESPVYYILQEVLTWTSLLGAPVDGAYNIDDTNDLVKLQTGVLSGLATADVTFKQTGNIDMTGVTDFYGIGWFKSSDSYASLPPGLASASTDLPFAGVYDGGGYKISNVKLVRHNYAGVFNCVEGTVKNLTVENLGFVDTSAGEWGCGIVGNAQGNAILEFLTAATSAQNGFWGDNAPHNTAGIAARAEDNATIRYCVNNAAITASAKRLGGIISFTGTAGTGTDVVSIIACTNNGALYSSNGTRGVGGIIASPESTTAGSMTLIKDCANFGMLTAGSSGFTGEIVGSMGVSVASTWQDDGGNTFLASGNLVGTRGSNTKEIVGLAYAIDAGIDGGNYLTTVKAADLAAGNTYVLLANAAPVFALAAVGDTIAFDTSRGYTLDGSGITFASGTVTASTSDTVTTYTAALSSYTITYMYGETVLSGLTPATYTVADAVTLPTEVNLGVTGVAFESWTNAAGTVVSNWVAGAMTGNQTFYAKTYVPGPAYPTYLEGASAEVKAQYVNWAQTYAPDTESVYEDAFLLNVAPDTTGATIDATAISISGTTVTIDINRGNLNGVPYVKKASTVAGLATAPQTAITIVPADEVQDLDNGGRVTLENESGTAQFYQIGVQSTPLNQN